jgi:hypothetical protein
MADRTGRSRSRRSGAYLGMAGMAASVLVSSAVARADTTDELIDQLKAKGILTKAECAKLKHRHEAELKRRQEAELKRRKEAEAAAKAAAQGAPGTSASSDRYVTALDKGIGLHIPGQQIVTKDNGVVTVGDVDLKITGSLIFFGAEDFKSTFSGTAGIPVAPALPTPGFYGVFGGLAGGSPYNNANAIRSGLLPSNVDLSLATNQMGLDLGWTVGAYFGGNNINTSAGQFNANNPGAPVGLGTPGIDIRQIFGTIGTPEWGTVKIGRDLGLFAGEAILNDFTLFGVGTPAANAAPSNTALGRIGLGYVYADWIPQITYRTPDFGGFTAAVGIFTPLDAINETGDVFGFAAAAPGFSGPALSNNGVAIAATSGTMTAHDQPQFQGEIEYVGKFAPDVKFTAWADGITQLQRVSEADVAAALVSGGPGASVRSSGVDVGARLDLGGFSAVGYGYWGSALGTTGLFWDAISPNGQARNSNGWYAEAEYTFFDRLTFGGSYGRSVLVANNFDYTQAYVLFLLRSNQSAIAFARYKLTDWVAFQAEFIDTLSISQFGGAVRSNAVVGGTTFFF